MEEKENTQKNIDDNLTPSRKRKSLFQMAGLALGVLMVILAIPTLYIRSSYPAVNPIKAYKLMQEFKNQPHKDMSKRTMGYAPYWQMDKMQNVRYDLLTDLIYFSLTVDEDGHFAKTDASGKEDEGWAAWNGSVANEMIAKTQISGGRAGLTIALLRNKKIESFLISDTAQSNLINETIKEIRKKNLKMINLDFEYTGEPPEELPAKFTNFVGWIDQELASKAPDVELDINLKARSGRAPGLFEIEKLNSHIDQYIVMSYDYYTAGSDSAGPVAPMNGADNKRFFFDVTTTYEDLLKLMPADKIVMGVPYYGYDWPVKDKTNNRSLALPQSDENGGVETLSYGRARDDKTFQGENCNFDKEAQQPWCGYVDPETGKDRVAWFENNKSIEVKYNYAKEQNFGGIAIWTLSYDRNYPDLWELLERTFGK